MTPGQVLRNLRKSKCLTINELSVLIGIGSSMIGMLERNQRRLNNESLSKYINYFNVSSDFILGVKYDDIDIAFYNQLGELTDAQKQDVIRYAEFVRSKNV